MAMKQAMLTIVEVFSRMGANYQHIYKKTYSNYWCVTVAGHGMGFVYL